MKTPPVKKPGAFICLTKLLVANVSRTSRLRLSEGFPPCVRLQSHLAWSAFCNWKQAHEVPIRASHPLQDCSGLRPQQVVHCHIGNVRQTPLESELFEQASALG